MLLAIGAGYAAFRILDLDYQVMALVFLFAIVLLSLRFARGPVLAATMLSALALNFLFIQPYLSFTIAHISDFGLFVLYFGIAVVVGVLTTRLRNTALLLRQREAACGTLEFASDMSRAATMDDVCGVAVDRRARSLTRRRGFCCRDSERQLRLKGELCPATDPLVAERELGAAALAYAHGHPAGKYTDTLPTATLLHVPMLSVSGVVGVLSLDLKNRPRTQQSNLLAGLASQTALAVEREQLGRGGQSPQRARRVRAAFKDPAQSDFARTAHAHHRHYRRCQQPDRAGHRRRSGRASGLAREHPVVGGAAQSTDRNPLT